MAAIVLFGIGGFLGLFAPLDHLVWDAWTRWIPSQKNNQVVLVAIDERSLTKLGRLGSWDRRVYGTVVKNLLEAGVRGVGVDVLFPETTPQDAQIAAIFQNPKVVLANATLYGEQVAQNPNFSKARYGAILVNSSLERVVRQYQTGYMLGTTLTPSLPQALFGTGPVDTRSQYIRYAGSPGQSFSQLSFLDVLEGNVRYGNLQDTTVLIGVTAAGLERDQLLTPYLQGDPLPLLSGDPLPMSGVEVQANILHTLQIGSFTEISVGVAVVLALALMIFFALYASSLWWMLLSSAGVLLLSAGLHRFGVVLPTGALVLAAPMGFALYSYLALRDVSSQLAERLRQLGEGSASGAAQVFQHLALLRKVDHRLELEREQLNLLIHHVDQPLFLVDLAGVVQVSNPSAQTILQAGQVLGDKLQNRLGLKPGEFDFDELLESEGQLELFTSEGVLSLNVVRQNGKPRAVVGMFTKGSRMTQVVVQQGQQNETLIHEIRSPLTTLIGFTQYLEELARDDQRDILRMMLVEGDRISSVLSDFVDKNARLEREPLELSSLLRRISGTLRAEYHSRRIQLKLDLPGLLEFVGDEREISEIVLALLENAIRFSASGGEITLRLLEWENEIHIEVQDYGLGIAEHELPKIFSRHYRSENTRQHGHQGSGMGLWQARERAKAHGGDVRVFSVLGQGSTFRVILPSLQLKGNLHRDPLSA